MMDKIEIWFQNIMVSDKHYKLYFKVKE